MKMTTPARVYNLKSERLTHLPARKFTAVNLPASVQLANLPAIYNQGHTGSCTANSACSTFRYNDTNKDFTPSRLFLYYAERELDGDVQDDAGSSISRSINTLRTVGVCTESLWPYVESRFADRPSDECYINAQDHRVTNSTVVSPDTHSLKTVLAAGHAINVGIVVYASLESAECARTGIVELPSAGEQSLGGHAVFVVGYDDHKQHHAGVGMWKLVNSWGAAWGDHGSFWLPYGYLSDSNLSSDFWVITHVYDNSPAHSAHATHSGFSFSSVWHHAGDIISHAAAQAAYLLHFPL